MIYSAPELVKLLLGRRRIISRNGISSESLRIDDLSLFFNSEFRRVRKKQERVDFY